MPIILILLVILFASPAFALPDIVFVTQPPHPPDFATVNSTFANHRASLDSIPRGGDLYIRYSDGSVKNITRTANFGMDGFQGANAIAVRDPAVHWSGTKILFSMVIGAPTQQYQVASYRWQLYEVTGIGRNETPVITKLAKQPSEYNNVMGIYGTDDRIIFSSDRPRDGLTHTYPQRDEYESTATNTGLWSLDTTSGDLFQLDHSPSGDFHPIIDSFGRVLFTRWDHMQRDQQNRCSNQSFGAFNFSSEASGATALDDDAEVFPEPRAVCETQEENLDHHSFNLFLPWQIREDGKDMETLNHLGRHELVGYLGKSVNNDGNIEEFYGQYSRVNQNSINNFFQIAEDPAAAGTYFGINAPEFGTHASGQIIKLSAPPSRSPEQISIVYVTHPDTDGTDDTPSADHIGLSRDPLALTDGALVAAHSTSTQQDSNIGSSAAPQSKYSYRLRSYQTSGQYFVPGTFLTSEIKETISYWSPDQMVTYNNVTMWELQPKEIRARSRPTAAALSLGTPEKSIFDDLQINVEEFTAYLRENNLAVIVGRNVTTRDVLDRQQPFNLRVAGTNTKTVKNDGTLYDISHFQMFQGDLIRGYGGVNTASEGRRVIAQMLHSVDANPANPGGPAGSVKIASDGSIAAFVPARRALTYQTTNDAGKGVVRERFWLTFQPGEIRVCGSCHGVNAQDQAGHGQPENSPLALRTLLEHWKQLPPSATPQVSLRFQRKKKTAAKFKNGEKLTVQVNGENAQAAQKTFTLSISVGSADCGETKTFTTDSNGDYEYSTKKMPKLSKNATVEVRVSYRGNLVARRKFKITKTDGGSAKAGQKLCGALGKAFL